MEEMEINKKRDLLYEYLMYSYRPNLSDPIRRVWLKWFTMYWKDEIVFKELVRLCAVPKNLFIERLDIFIKLEDLE